jgi:serine/threonine protein kinase
VPLGSRHPQGRGVGGEGGRVKILDFGLARLTREEGANLTQTGVVLGTPAYMAPEQATGQKVDGRCDLFSLGCVLYQLCTGRLPFQGSDPMTVLLAVCREQPVPPRQVNPAVPPALADLVLRLLAKRPAERPASAEAVAQELQAIEEDRTEILSAGPGGTANRSRPGRGRRWLAWALALLALLVAGAAVLLLLHVVRPADGGSLP